MNGIGFPKPKRKIDEELLAKVREQPCAACGAPGPSDPSHLISRGAGGPDEEWNVAPHCRHCHQDWHLYGPRKFLRNYPTFKIWLEEHEWQMPDGGIPVHHRGW